MAQVLRLHYPAWDDYKSNIVTDLFGAENFASGTYLFRGCGNSDWTLTSSFDRAFSNLSTGRRLVVWQSLLQRFREVCADRGVPSLILDDERRLLAYGQHHGLPTRLLDWSLSPYIAAFFAFRASLSRPDDVDQVAVWMLDTRSEIWSPELGVELLAPPALENVRLLNQAGRFTYSRTPYRTLEEYVESSSCDGTPLRQVTIPRDEAVRALPDLEAMGVTPHHLFPGVGGLTESVTLAALTEAATQPGDY